MRVTTWHNGRFGAESVAMEIDKRSLSIEFKSGEYKTIPVIILEDHDFSHLPDDYDIGTQCIAPAKATYNTDIVLFDKYSPSRAKRMSVVRVNGENCWYKDGEILIVLYTEPDPYFKGPQDKLYSYAYGGESFYI